MKTYRSKILSHDQFFSKINTSLKSSATNGFSIPNIGFFIGDLYDSIFGFFEKSVILKDFVRKCTSNILCTIEVSNRSILKNYIYSLLDLLKQMSFHIVVIKIRPELAEIELVKTIFSIFSLVGSIPYCVLYKLLQQFLSNSQIQ